MKNRLRILELIFDFQVGGRGGGIGRFAIELCRTLDLQKFNIAIGGIFDRGTTLESNWIKQLRADGISAFYASKWDERHPYQSFWNSMRFIWEWQTQNRAEIIHSHSEFSDVVAMMLRSHPTKPAILRTVHYGYQYEWRKRPWRRALLTNFLYPLLFTKEIGVSQAITENLNQRYIIKLFKKRAQCIYNAIDIRRFQLTAFNRDAKRKELGIPVNALLVGTIGRLTEQKGYQYLLDAIAPVLKQIPDAFFLIVGDGELADDLKNQASNLEIMHRLQFTGSRTDVEEIISCFDLFVSASLWEGLPTVIMESMAAGIPIAATNIPGTRDLIEDQHTGWLFPPREASILAQGIQTALENPQLRHEFAQRAKKNIEQFSIKSIASEHERIYTSFRTAQQETISTD